MPLDGILRSDYWFRLFFQNIRLELSVLYHIKASLLESIDEVTALKL